MLRIQRQQDDLVALRGLQLRDRLGGKWMPVTHGHEAACVQTLLRQLCFEREGLLLGEAADGRASADRGVVVLHFMGAGGRNEFGKRLSPDAGEGKINDIGIAEEVIKKRFDRSQGVRTTQLKQNYPHTALWFRHPFRFPRTGESTPI